MAGEINYKVNEVESIQCNIPCRSCTGKTLHKVLVSVNAVCSERDTFPYQKYWESDYQVVQCLGCKTVSFRETYLSYEDYDYAIDGTHEYIVEETLYPSRLEGIKGLGDDEYYLPETVRRIYRETLMTLSSKTPILSGIGLRALLEAVCKEKCDLKLNLSKKINRLVCENILTPDNAKILHKIRTLGNAAAHKVEPHTDGQLELAMDIIEHLLKAVYILPKKMESEFKNQSRLTTPPTSTE